LGLPSAFSRPQLVRLLARMYPNHDWDTSSMLKGKFAQQKRIERAVIALFPVSCTTC